MRISDWSSDVCSSDLTEATRALRVAHAAFWLSPHCLSIGLIGPGNVGRALLAQLAEALPRFQRKPRTDKWLDLRLRAIADSRHMVLADRALAPAGAAAALSDSSTTLDLDHFASHVRAEHLPPALT